MRLAPEPPDFCITGREMRIQESKEFTIWEQYVVYFDSLNENTTQEFRIKEIATETNKALSIIWSILLDHNDIPRSLRENILNTLVKHKLSKDNENSWFLLVNNSNVMIDVLNALGVDDERHSLPKINKVRNVLKKIER